METLIKVLQATVKETVSLGQKGDSVMGDRKDTV